jgi:hypothetical protein
MMTARDKNVPILISGAHRSGTTWVGKTLAQNPGVTYISEPLNVLHRPGVMRVPVQYWYEYICDQNESAFLPAIQDTINFKYHYWLEFLSLRSVKDVGRMVRDSGQFLLGRIKLARPLIKDPFAVFSVPWFVENFNCQVVIVVRHPLGFVSSLKRLGWQFNFRDLLSQPLLVEAYLDPFLEEMQSISNDVIDQGCLLWRMVYRVVAIFRQQYPELIIVRHEDLSRDPIKEFESLFQLLRLEFSPNIRRSLEISTNSNNPQELSKRRVHSTKLDSRANLGNWHKRLNDAEIERIQNLTSDIRHMFYTDDPWS